MDVDNNGSISPDELVQAMSMLHSRNSPEEMLEAARRVDADGSGEIDFDEFLQVLVIQEEELEQKRHRLKKRSKVFNLLGVKEKQGEPEHTGFMGGILGK